MNNKGWGFERIEHNPKEKAFAEFWEKENDPEKMRAVNFGYGILQDLFIRQDGPVYAHRGGSAAAIINNRDRFIVATVIQWLGSNCGYWFLQQALGKCGYEIVRKADF